MVRALACHAGDPGSIPGVCLYFILFLSHLVSKKVEFKTFLNPFSLNVQRLYCFYYIHIRSQNPIEKSFVMIIEVTNLKWIRLRGGCETPFSKRNYYDKFINIHMRGHRYLSGHLTRSKNFKTPFFKRYWKFLLGGYSNRSRTSPFLFFFKYLNK